MDFNKLAEYDSELGTIFGHETIVDDMELSYLKLERELRKWTRLKERMEKTGASKITRQELEERLRTALAHLDTIKRRYEHSRFQLNRLFLEHSVRHKSGAPL